MLSASIRKVDVAAIPLVLLASPSSKDPGVLLLVNSLCLISRGNALPIDGAPAFTDPRALVLLIRVYLHVSLVLSLGSIELLHKDLVMAILTAVPRVRVPRGPILLRVNGPRPCCA